MRKRILGLFIFSLFGLCTSTVSMAAVDLETEFHFRIVEETEETEETAEVQTETQTKAQAQEGEGEAELPAKAALEMKSILQLPELPTGCESVALTMLLDYYGYTWLEKTTIADEYLVYSDNFVIGYTGDPYTYEGAGCYAPGMARTANDFLKAQGSALRAADLTGSTEEELYALVAEETPVLIWNTAYFADSSPSGEYCEYKGKAYEWDYNEHCVVLVGYDMEQNTVLVNDPLEGRLEPDADRFWELYEELGSMAVALREGDEETETEENWAEWEEPGEGIPDFSEWPEEGFRPHRAPGERSGE